MSDLHRSVDLLSDLALQAGLGGAKAKDKRPDTVASIQPPTYEFIDSGASRPQLAAESLDTKTPVPSVSSSSSRPGQMKESLGGRPSKGDRTRLSPYESVALPPSLSGRRPATTPNTGAYRRPPGHSPYDPVSLPPSLAGPRRPSTTEGRTHRGEPIKAHGRGQSSTTAGVSSRQRSNSQSRRSAAPSMVTSSPPPSPRSGRSQTRPTRPAAPQQYQRARSHSRSRSSQPKDQNPTSTPPTVPTTRRRAHSQSSTTRHSLAIPSSSHIPSSLPLPGLLSSVESSDDQGLSGSKKSQKREDKRRRAQSESGASRRPTLPDPSSLPKLPTNHRQSRPGTEAAERIGEHLSPSRVSETPDLGRDARHPPPSTKKQTNTSREKYHPKSQPMPIKGMSSFAYAEGENAPELRRKASEDKPQGATCWTLCLASLCFRRGQSSLYDASRQEWKRANLSNVGGGPCVQESVNERLFVEEMNAAMDAWFRLQTRAAAGKTSWNASDTEERNKNTAYPPPAKQ